MAGRTGHEVEHPYFRASYFSGVAYNVTQILLITLLPPFPPIPSFPP
jgi:hypothetical protein